MDTSALHILVVVAETLSTTDTASRLSVSQSTISRTIAALESEFGIPLFIRRKGRLHTTHELTQLLPSIKQLITEENKLLKTAQQLRILQRQKFRIRFAASSTFLDKCLTSALPDFLKRHPDVGIDLSHDPYEQLETALINNELDLAFLRLGNDIEGLIRYPLFETQIVCVMHRSHPLAQRPFITPQDLHHQAFILTGRDRPIRMQIDHILQIANVKLRVMVEARSISVACDLVSKNQGVSLVNGLLAELCKTDEIILKPFTPKIAYHFGLLARKEIHHNLLIQSFIKHLTEQLTNDMSSVFHSQRLD